MRFAILGAGGVGGVFGGMLARSGHPAALLARGEHLAAIRARGLEVRTPEETFVVPMEASDDAASFEGIDVALVAVKGYSLNDIAPAASLLASRGATILPLLNGVEASDRLVARGVPRERILEGVAEISAARVAPGAVARFSPFRRVVVGEVSGEASERATGVAAAFAESGLEARVSRDIVSDLWRKLAFISSVAAACGLSRSSIGPIRTAPLGALLLERAVREVLAVGRARGVSLPDELEAKVLHQVDVLAPHLRPSFLLDLLAGGPTELDDLCGAVSRIGRTVGVETPVNDVATAALSVRA